MANASGEMKETIYLTRTGLLEPLGQSQVFAYLRGLSQTYKITLITHDKEDDLNDQVLVDRAKDECAQLGITWLPQPAILKPRYIAPLWAMLKMFWLVLSLTKKRDIGLIHARSYLPAAVAWVVWRLRGTPFVFDMRALWPEELIASGRLKRDMPLHKLIVCIERICLRDAAAVVSLTHAAVGHLKRVYPSELGDKQIVVIPTCADLERFNLPIHKGDCKVIGCLGSVLTGWFNLDWLSNFMSVVARQDASIHFEITTKDDGQSVKKRLTLPVDIVNRVNVASSPSNRVQEVLHGQFASVMFFTQGLSKLGSSPTRMGEILGCGLPVVANNGVGDVAKVIQEFNVGVLVNSASNEDMLLAWNQLQVLLQDPGLAARCRRAAESVFSLKQGTQSYFQLYKTILENKWAHV